MGLYNQLQKAKSEEDVKDAYIKAKGLKSHTKDLIDRWIHIASAPRLALKKTSWGVWLFRHLRGLWFSFLTTSARNFSPLSEIHAFREIS